MTRLTRWFLPDTPDLLGMLDRQAAITLNGMQEFAAWSAGDHAAGQRVRKLEHEADDACRVLRGALREAFTTPLEPEDLFSLSERLDVVLNEAKNTVREADLLGVTHDAHTAAMGSALLSSTEHVVAGLALLGRHHAPPPVRAPRDDAGASGSEPEQTSQHNGNGYGNGRGNGNGNGRGWLMRALRTSQASSAPDAADRAIKAERAVEHEYRRAMSSLSLPPGPAPGPDTPGGATGTVPATDLSQVTAIIARQEVYRRFTTVGEALVKVADRIWYATVKNE